MTIHEPHPEASSHPSEQLYPLVNRTDGCDNTIEIRSANTNRRIAWAAYWDDEPGAIESAQSVAAFLEAVASGRVTIDLGALLAELKQVAAEWGWNELRAARPDLADETVWTLLCEHHYYSPVGDERPFPAALIAQANKWYPQQETSG